MFVVSFVGDVIIWASLSVSSSITSVICRLMASCMCHKLMLWGGEREGRSKSRAREMAGRNSEQINKEKMALVVKF